MTELYKQYQNEIVRNNFNNCLGEREFNKEISNGKTVKKLVKEWIDGYKEQERIMLEMEMAEIEDSRNDGMRDQEEQIQEHIMNGGNVSDSQGNDITYQYT